MPNILLNLPDAVAEKLDATAAANKTKGGATADQIAEAHNIANRRGVDAANEYLRSVQGGRGARTRTALARQIIVDWAELPPKVRPEDIPKPKTRTFQILEAAQRGEPIPKFKDDKKKPKKKPKPVKKRAPKHEKTVISGQPPLEESNVPPTLAREQ